MNFRSFETLRKVGEQDSVYDMFILSYNVSNINSNLNVFITEKRHEMKLTLVSYDIYGTIENTDILMAINDIANPMSIKAGQLILYLDLNFLNNLIYNDPKLVSDDRDILINNLKKRNLAQANHNRSDNILPPTVSNPSASKSVLENDRIKVAPNLFSNPNTEVKPENKTIPSSSLGDVFNGFVDDSNIQIVQPSTIETPQTERILVRTFIRNGDV